MARKIFIGELNASTSEDALRSAFDSYGVIVELSIDAAGGHIEYRTDEAGDTAIKRMDGTTLDGATITVSEETPPIT